MAHLQSLDYDVTYSSVFEQGMLPCLTKEGLLRITDFGLAKDTMELADKTHTFCGTPDYIAPEIIAGKGHDHAVDSAVG